MELIFSTTSMCKQAKIFFNDFVVSERVSGKTMSNFIISYFITSLSFSFFLTCFNATASLFLPSCAKNKIKPICQSRKKSLLTNKKEKFYLQKNRVMIHCGMSRKFPLERYVTRNLCA